MSSYSLERKIRAGFPVVRFMQSFLPLSISRWFLKQGMRRYRPGSGMLRLEVLADGVPCEWIIHNDCPPGRVLLYLHGGGFVLGQTPLHLRMGEYLAKKTGVLVLMVDYRLAPEFPFPLALDDSVTAYQWLLKQGISAHDIVIGGDSAGGNLTITSMMRLRDMGIPLPSAAACLSPLTDLSGNSNKSNSYKDPLLPSKAVKFYKESYVGVNDAHNPLISPVFGDLHGLAPLLVHAGEDEILSEDAIRIVSLAKAAGVEARLEIYPRMWHVWQLYLSLPQALQSLDDIALFLKSHLVNQET